MWHMLSVLKGTEITKTYVNQIICFYVQFVFFLLLLTSRKEEYFQCNSGQKVDQYNVCDGKVDCQDFTDESNATCSTFMWVFWLYACLKESF